MDFNKLSTGDKLVAGGAGLFLISTLLPWFSIDTVVGDYSANGWDYGLSGVVGLLLLLAAAALVVLPAAGKSINAPAIVSLVISALATLMVVVRFLVGQDGFSRSFGIVLAVISAGAATFGAFTKFKAAGGNLDDLKDPTKLKNQMQSGFSSLAKDLKEKGEDLKDKGGDVVDKVEEKFDPKD